MWEVLHEPGVEGEARWAADSGLRVAGAVGVADVAGQRPGLGTAAVVRGAGWERARVSVRVGPEAVGAAGILFGYAGPGDYHRLTIQAETGDVGLVQVRDDVAERLGGGRVVAPEGQWRCLTVAFDGWWIEAHLDGVAVVQVELDEPLQGGRVGLHAAGSELAEFAELRVQGRSWRPFHVFEQDTSLSEGAQVRVFSGAARHPAEKTLLTARRFVAGPFEPGALHFAGGRTELRVRTPDGAIEHRRTFVDRGEAQEVRHVLVRNLDGTACFLLPEGGGAFEPGHYRLEATYRRAVGEEESEGSIGLPPLVGQSQSGIHRPEHVVPDLPWRPAE